MMRLFRILGLVVVLTLTNYSPAQGILQFRLT
jgi:hypothetical protein